MPKKVATTVKQDTKKKAADNTTDIGNISDTIDYEIITAEELIAKIRSSDSHFEEVFSKLQELFLGVSHEMEKMNQKRERCIIVLKAVHQEYKKNHPEGFDFPEISDEEINGDIIDEIGIDIDAQEIDTGDIYDEEPLKPKPKAVAKKTVAKPKPEENVDIKEQAEVKPATKAPAKKAPAKSPAKKGPAKKT